MGGVTCLSSIDFDTVFTTFTLLGVVLFQIVGIFVVSGGFPCIAFILQPGGPLIVFCSRYFQSSEAGLCFVRGWKRVASIRYTGVMLTVLFYSPL